MRLERLYRRRVPPDSVISPELARACTELSSEIRRQIGLVITRRGLTQMVIVGDGKELDLTPLSRFQIRRQSLRGVRLVHTHLHDEPLSHNDLTNLALLRLDLIAALGVNSQGMPGSLALAHILPPNPRGQVYEVWVPRPFHLFQLDCGKFVEALETELARAALGHEVREGQETAILVSASRRSRLDQEERLKELADLVQSDGIAVLDMVTQRCQEIHPKFLLGRERLKDVVIKALQRGADLLIFEQDLSPTQVRAIAEVTEMKVIDRTQVILDIFARRAHSREGKVRVELAQLQYMLPRLLERSTALSRLGGGIGGRGPGETKLETDRRRVRDRITHLERQLRAFARQQDQRRDLRSRRMIPIVSLVGYTNAGKSTLLNALTKSRVPVGNRFFETLETCSRRLRLPGLIALGYPREVILADTVGFIRDLPKDLMGAFRATLEELRLADVLLHVVDASAGDPKGQLYAVEAILTELGFIHIPRLLVFNKCDRVPPAEAKALCRRFGAIGVSALFHQTLEPIVQELERTLSTCAKASVSPYQAAES